MMVSGAGNAPARSRMARSFACCTVKLPEICPEPPRIGSRITGAEITLLSSTMANGLPTFSWVASANLRAPDRIEAEVDDRLAGALVEARLGVGQIGAGNQHALLDQIFLAGLRRRGFPNPAADAFLPPAPRVIDRSTMRKSSLAVLPRISLSRVGSCRPGTCTRMRSTPSRWMVGSTRPSSLTRRSMIWID